MVGEGTHGEVRRAEVRRWGRTAVVCFKLFTEEWLDAYERELSAYELLRNRGVTRCIPRLYFKCEWPRWRWDGEEPGIYFSEDERNEKLYGIVMEYFADCRQLNLGIASLQLAERVGEALDKIHEGGVVHRDLAERNILLVRESGRWRVVWIDFSCAWSGKQYEPTCIMEWDEFRGLLLENMVISFVFLFSLPGPKNYIARNPEREVSPETSGLGSGNAQRNEKDC
jgi:serine/threonine protein kinase